MKRDPVGKTGFFCFLLFLLLHLGSTAQSYPFKSTLWIEGRLHYGYVAPHHEYMLHLTSQHFTMFELSVYQATTGQRLWEQLHKYPIKGISLLYTDLGGAEYLGKAMGVYPYLDFQLTKGKKINLFFKFGAGLGYLTKHFTRNENWKNGAIGSHFNILAQIMYEMRWKPFPRWSVNLGISLTHFSNGAMKAPNLGINIPTLNLSLAYKADRTQPERIKNEVPALNKKKWEFNIIGLFGVSELYRAYGQKYWAGAVSASFLKPMSPKRKIGIGLDVFYDEAVIECLRRANVEISHKLEVVRPGLTFTHKMEFSHFAIVMQAGGYVYTKYKGDGYIYDRLALQYRIGQHAILHLALKTHLFVADMIEYGVGYKF